MSKVKTRTQENNFSVLQILGRLFLIFAVADFALSWMGQDFHQLFLELLDLYY